MEKSQLIKLAEDLNTSCESLCTLLEEVFETSLNTSLAVGKIRSGDSEIEAYKVIASHVEAISKKLKISIIDLIDENKKILKLVTSCEVTNSTRTAVEGFFKILELLEKRNQQIWLTMNQFRVQLSQSNDSKSLVTISTNIDLLSSRLEVLLGDIHAKATLLSQLLSSQPSAHDLT